MITGTAGASFMMPVHKGNPWSENAHKDASKRPYKDARYEKNRVNSRARNRLREVHCLQRHRQAC
jgi:hypothetical protein